MYLVTMSFARIIQNISRLHEGISLCATERPVSSHFRSISDEHTWVLLQYEDIKAHCLHGIGCFTL